MNQMNRLILKNQRSRSFLRNPLYRLYLMNQRSRTNLTYPSSLKSLMILMNL